MKKNVLILIAVLAVAAAAWIWDSQGNASGKVADSAVEGNANSDIPSAPSPKDNRYAPPISLSSLDGASKYEIGGKRDKAMIVNFWAAWCGPCEKEAPELKSIYEDHKDKLDLYAVNATKYDKLREAKDFVKEQGFDTFPVLTDPEGDGVDLYKVSYFPVSFIIDRDGVIRHRVEGIIDRKQWEQYLADVL
ncbi:TlpA family protein disulfide reductase [Cohnella suwonensis]|uniref:TlpA family protein disulfide reductase n=1 Tax=Cohnella suwonensis TaxID=696072 RepID=A0ABW0LW89_9BACL